MMHFCCLRWFSKKNEKTFSFRKKIRTKNCTKLERRPRDFIFMYPDIPLTWKQQEMWLSWRYLRRTSPNKERYLQCAHNPRYLYYAPEWYPYKTLGFLNAELSCRQSRVPKSWGLQANRAICDNHGPFNQRHLVCRVSLRVEPFLAQKLHLDSPFSTGKDIVPTIKFNFEFHPLICSRTRYASTWFAYFDPLATFCVSLSHCLWPHGLYLSRMKN